jgi:thioesterase domain-containing protein/acyl carrier protein
LPLSASGKLDRSALPRPAIAGAVADRAPRTITEQVLADLFAEVLHAKRIGPNDSFFNLGGHSLIVPRLAARIETALGARLNIRDLFDSPTPAELAALIESGSAGRGSPLAPLLQLRGGTNVPLFCVHPAAGIGWVYSGLLRYLAPDQPVYSLQARGLADFRYAPTSVDDLIADYITLIREAQPYGPYAFLGWSLGGLVAHRLAVRLQDAGEQVAFLGLLDSYPSIRAESSRAEQESDLLSHLARSLGRELSTDGELLGLADLAVGPVLQVFASLRRLLSDAEPGTFRGTALLFAAADELPEVRLAHRPEHWHPYVRGGVDVVPVPCCHGEMTGATALSVIGPVVSGRLSAIRHSK